MGVRIGSKTGTWLFWKLGLKSKISKKLEVSSVILIDLILALTVICQYNTHAAHGPGSLFSCHVGYMM